MKKISNILKTASISLAISFICTTQTFAISSAINSRFDKAIMIFIGSPKAYVNNSESKVDTSNDNVVPVIVNGRTLVPVRFLSEKFGATVGWDSRSKTATINLNGKNVQIKLGSSQMNINENMVNLDSPAQSINGRTFLPLRKLVEDVLGKKVFYSNGLIIISEDAAILDANFESDEIDQICLERYGSVEMNKKNLANLNMLIPKSFKIMSDEMIKINYTNENKPKIIYTNVASSVNIAGNSTDTNLNASEIGRLKDYMVQISPNKVKGFSLISSGVVDNGKKVGYLEFISKANDTTEVYNLMFFTDVNGKMTFFYFSCVKSEMDLWESTAFKILNSING